MASVREHYEGLLAEHYTWMFGDHAAQVAQQREFFTAHGITPESPGASALDLGAGSGFQSVALAQLGYKVTAVDVSSKMLAELRRRAGDLSSSVETLEADIVDALGLNRPPFSVIVCMGDTLAHLDSLDQIEHLFRSARVRMARGAKLVLSFRDQSADLAGTDRIIPIRADDDVILTCFLEVLPERVHVHDVVHSRGADGSWTVKKSAYTKLRLSSSSVQRALHNAELAIDIVGTLRSQVAIIARRP